MFKKIMFPVDLGALDALERALDIAVRMAREGGAELCFVGVYGSAPSSEAHFTAKYKEKLAAFAAQQGAAHKLKTSAYPAFSHDPAVEIASTLLDAIGETGADAVVMASHMPGWMEHVFHSNAGYVACHAPVSVFVVR
ncbi:MAG: universal stress protein [Pseudomonadota bacterium]